MAPASIMAPARGATTPNAWQRSKPDDLIALARLGVVASLAGAMLSGAGAMPLLLLILTWILLLFEFEFDRIIANILTSVF